MPNRSILAKPSNGQPSNREQRIEALKCIEELSGLSEQEFYWITEKATERFAQDGEVIFSQAEPPHHLIFVLAGQVAIKRHTSSPVTVFTGRTGRITGKTPFSRLQAWNADGRAEGDVWLLELHENSFADLLTIIPSMTERMVHVLVERNREYTRAEEQIGKLSALSKLAGNLAHELNNPASAGRSAALSLTRELEKTSNDVRYQFGLALPLQETRDQYFLEMDVIRLKIRESNRTTRSVSDGNLEDALADWMQDKGFAEGWKLAPMLAEAQLSPSDLDTFLVPVPSHSHSLALRDLLATLSQDAAISAVMEATNRIFQIIAAVKDYSYMDRQPFQAIDVPTALENVLKMFQPRLTNVVVSRNFTPGVPPIQGHGSELNQAFSALIENSLDAMEDRGTLRLSVKLQGNTVLIEIEDNGRGIPVEFRDRVFEPFFTTKPVGKGLGLGLDTVQRVAAKHFGAVAFDTSEHGTTFHLRLPIERVGIY